MSDTLKPYRMITDFITGRSIPDMGAEANRQAVERLLVETKGFAKQEIAVDVEMSFEVSGQPYQTWLDLVVSVADIRYMVIKCAAGSLGSREREVVAAARLLDENAQIPLSVVSDGKTAIVLDTVTGKTVGEGLTAIPSKEAVETKLNTLVPLPLARDRRNKERLIFRTYDTMNVNRAHRA